MKVQTAVGLVAVPKPQRLPGPIVIGTFFRADDLHAQAGQPVGNVEGNAALHACHQELIRPKLRHQGAAGVIVRAGGKLPLRVTANTGNVALRVPEAPICRAVVSKLGLPITATSANLRGLPECTWAGCVHSQFGDKIPLIVDGGPTARTVPTTIVDLSGGENSWMILREGAIPTHEVALALQR